MENEHLGAAFYNSIEPYLETKKRMKKYHKYFTRLVIAVMPEGDRFRLYKPFTYYWRDQEGKILPITVPVGFDTDFASIPPIVRLLIAKLGRYNGPSVIHDWLYRHHYIETDNIYYSVNRKLADLIFFDGMKDNGVVPWKRKLMYYGVRCFGFLAWH